MFAFVIFLVDLIFSVGLALIFVFDFVSTFVVSTLANFALVCLLFGLTGIVSLGVSCASAVSAVSDTAPPTLAAGGGEGGGELRPTLQQQLSVFSALHFGKAEWNKVAQAANLREFGLECVGGLGGEILYVLEKIFITDPVFCETERKSISHGS